MLTTMSRKATVHLDSVADPSSCFPVIDVGQCQGLTVCESFASRSVSLKDKAFHGVKNHDL